MAKSGGRSSGKTTVRVHRSSKTGKWVTPGYAAKHPATTETETVTK